MGSYPFAPPGLTPYPDQLPAAVYGTAPAGILALAAAVANRNAARLDIPVIGDSVTEGQGATTVNGRWIAQANRAMRAAYPTTANGAAGAQGFIPVSTTGETSFTWPVTLASGGSGSFVAPVGPVRDAITLGAATTYTWTAPAGSTSCKVMYFDDGSGSTFSWKVNAGAATNVAQNTFSGDGALTASIPITAGQVLTIAWVSGATVILEGIVPFSGDEAAGITFHACGHFGWQAGQQDANAWNQTGYSVPWQQSLGALMTGAGAVGIMLGINDCASYTAAGFAANLKTLVTFIQGGLGHAALPVSAYLFIIPYQSLVVPLDPGGWPAYAAAVRSVAAATSVTVPSHVIDLSYRMPSIASGFDGGALYADSFHPGNLGHALIGEIAAAGLRIG